MKILLTALLLLSVSLSFAHPHVWIESYLYFNKETIDVRWQFDKMFSNIMFMDFDIDGDKQFIGMEAKRLKTDMFDNLKNFDFFFKVYCGNELLDVKYLKGFRADSKDNRVSYRFTLSAPMNNCRKELFVYVFDETMFSDITLKSAKGVKVNIVEDVGGRKYIKIK